MRETVKLESSKEVFRRSVLFKCQLIPMKMIFFMITFVSEKGLNIEILCRSSSFAQGLKLPDPAPLQGGRQQDGGVQRGQDPQVPHGVPHAKWCPGNARDVG